VARAAALWAAVRVEEVREVGTAAVKGEVEQGVMSAEMREVDWVEVARAVVKWESGEVRVLARVGKWGATEAAVVMLVGCAGCRFSRMDSA
jgi:hypothetical protein